MKKFPVTVVDNFYESPDLVRQFALSLKFNPTEDGRWPGERTKLLSEIDSSFFKIFCDKLFSLFYNFENESLSWKVETSFQKVFKFSEDRNSSFNNGWIHKDECVFSGVIYLNSNPEKNTGTSIYKIKDSEIDDNNQNEKFIFYSGKDISEEKYKKSINHNNNKFEETIRIENFYNRLVLFEGGQYHGVPSFYSNNNDARLTQVFFVKSLETESSNYPIIRMKNP